LKSGGDAVYTTDTYEHHGEWDMRSRRIKHTLSGNWSELLPGKKYTVTMTESTDEEWPSLGRRFVNGKEVVDVTTVIAEQDRRGDLRCCCDKEEDRWWWWADTSDHNGICKVFKERNITCKSKQREADSWGALGDIHHYTRTKKEPYLGARCTVSADDVADLLANAPQVTTSRVSEVHTVQITSGAGSRYSWHMDLEFKVGPTGLKVSNQTHWPTVVAVDPGSRAEQLGVKVGWRVVKVAQDGFSEDWRNSCSQRSCFVGLQYGEPWFANQTLLVRFGLDDQQGYDEVRMGSTQLKKVSNPDAPAFWGTDDD
jgi:hypothetical protein